MENNKKKMNYIVVAGASLAVLIILGIVISIMLNPKDSEKPHESESGNITSESISTETETELPEIERIETEIETDETEEKDQSASGNTTTTPSQPSTPSTPSTPTTPSQPSTPSTPSQPTTPSYDPADKNNDGFVSVEEQMMHITPAKQKCIDAGYGVVVELDGGTWYAVLVEDPYYTYNGMTGSNLLREYLKERNLHAEHVGGCWINPDNGWYWYTAEGITKIPESSAGDGPIDWDDVEWEIN